LDDIRILLVDMPRLAREMIDAAIATQRDMCVVDVATERDDLLAAARRTQPNFVIVGLEDDTLPDDCLQLFDEQPKVKFLGLETNGAHACLYELRPERRPLGDVSPADIVDAIRSAAAGRR